MKFLKELVEVKSEFELKRNTNLNHYFRLFEHIYINDNLKMSIQASYAHYCNPRVTLDDLSQYKTMEFALISADGEFLTVTEVLPTFLKLDQIEEYGGPIYAYVPVRLIEQLYRVLNKK